MQANARWMHPLRTSSQATKAFTAAPAVRGDAIARTPATIMSTLSPIDHPTDFFTNPTADVALIVSSPSSGSFNGLQLQEGGPRDLPSSNDVAMCLRSGLRGLGLCLEYVDFDLCLTLGSLALFFGFLQMGL